MITAQNNTLLKGAVSPFAHLFAISIPSVRKYLFSQKKLLYTPLLSLLYTPSWRWTENFRLAEFDNFYMHIYNTLWNI